MLWEGVDSGTGECLGIGVLITVDLLGIEVEGPGIEADVPGGCRAVLEREGTLDRGGETLEGACMLETAEGMAEAVLDGLGTGGATIGMGPGGLGMVLVDITVAKREVSLSRVLAIC